MYSKYIIVCFRKTYIFYSLFPLCHENLFFAWLVYLYSFISVQNMKNWFAYTAWGSVEQNKQWLSPKGVARDLSGRTSSASSTSAALRYTHSLPDSTCVSMCVYSRRSSHISQTICMHSCSCVCVCFSVCWGDVINLGWEPAALWLLLGAIRQVRQLVNRIVPGPREQRQHNQFIF